MVNNNRQEFKPPPVEAIRESPLHGVWGTILWHNRTCSLSTTGMVWTNGYQLQSRDYRIERVLGQGGFGITYKARHLNLDQDFVIKTPNEHLKFDPDYPKFVDRFIKEGQRIAKLCTNPHPHIVRVFDLFQEGDTHCLVMDFIPGESLWQRVRDQEGALPETEAVKYFQQIGEALQRVHEAGLVHRDAHPGNIMFRGDSAVLIDFGIAGEIFPITMTSNHFGMRHLPL